MDIGAGYRSLLCSVRVSTHTLEVKAQIEQSRGAQPHIIKAGVIFFRPHVFGVPPRGGLFA